LKVSRAKLLQAAASILLLAALGFLVDWRAIALNVRQADPLWLVWAVVAILAARLTISWRWMILLNGSGYPVRLDQLFGIVSAGIGVGSLLPTSIGPDVVRGALLARRGQVSSGDAQLGLVVSSVVLDRVAATLGTLFVAVVATWVAGIRVLAWPVTATFLGAAAMLWIAVRIGPGIVGAFVPERLGRIRRQLQMLLSRLQEPTAMRSLVSAVAVSVLMTLARTMMFVCLYRAFGYAVPLDHALVMIPLLLIALVLPISIGGFGLREWVLVVGFQGIGIPADVSVSVGILSFALQLAVSAPWVISHLMRWSDPRLPVEPAPSPQEK
jgi:glycosyltransferase 2 family protein